MLPTGMVTLPGLVAEWLAARWPLRRAEVADPHAVADACLADLEETLFEAIG